MVVIAAGCALFVTSQCDVKFTFQIQRFGAFFWHNANHYTRTLLIHCCRSKCVTASMWQSFRHSSVILIGCKWSPIKSFRKSRSSF